MKNQRELTGTQNSRLRKVLSNFSKARVMVLGDFILDEFIWGSVSRISPEAPVPVVKVQRQSFVPGGSLNVANNVKVLKGKVVPVGILGKDLVGRMLVKTIRQEGINTGGVIYDAKRPTTLKTRIIAHHQQVVRFDKEHADEISVPDRKAIIQFVKKNIKDVDVLLIEDYGKGVITPELLKAVLPLAKKMNKPILVDPKEEHFHYYKGVTALTPNRYEAYSALNLKMNGKVKVDEVGRTILKKHNLECLLVTLGEEGMALYERNGKITRIPTAAREVFDVSGAGDTVIAVFALAIASGAKFSEAALLANVAAGIVVGKLGTATVDQQELLHALSDKRGGVS